MKKIIGNESRAWNDKRYLSIKQASMELAMPEYLIEEALIKNNIPCRYRNQEKVYLYRDINNSTIGLDW